ncbi:MAG: hypothetical protein C5B49_16400 [Bdellovibrio sp.]|nr:MAG: hypothetical protein C5B49_16400 [Bdellovibrio sp.]
MKKIMPMKKIVKRLGMSAITVWTMSTPMGTLHAEELTGAPVADAQSIVKVLRKNRPTALEGLFQNLDEAQREDLIVEVRQALASEQERIKDLSAEIDKGNYNKKRTLRMLTAASVTAAVVFTVAAGLSPYGPPAGYRAPAQPSAEPAPAPKTASEQPRLHSRVLKKVTAYYQEVSKRVSNRVLGPSRYQAFPSWKTLVLSSTAGVATGIAIATEIALNNLPDDNSEALVDSKANAELTVFRMQRILTALALSFDADEAHSYLWWSI